MNADIADGAIGDDFPPYNYLEIHDWEREGAVPIEFLGWQGVDGPDLGLHVEDAANAVIEIGLPQEDRVPVGEDPENPVADDGLVPPENGEEDMGYDPDDPMPQRVPVENRDGRRRPYSPATRGRFVGLRDSGLTQQEIAEAMGVSRTTVGMWIRRANMGMSMEDLDRPGRPRKTTPEEDHEIAQIARQHPLLRDGAAGVARMAEAGVSRYTVRRRLKEQGLHCHQPAHKPGINEDHRRRRVLFAEEHLQDPDREGYYASFVFVDEKTYNSNTDGKIICYRPADTRYDRNHVVPKWASGHISLGYWGAMSIHGPGPLVPTGPRLTGQRYCNILSEYLIPWTAELFGQQEEFYLSQDNAPWHHNRWFDAWKEEHPWVLEARLPPCGSEINLMETVWAETVNTWDNENERTEQALDAHVRHQWDLLHQRPEFFVRLYEGFPRRLEAIINSNGYAIGW